MNELLIAVKAYVNACNITRPEPLYSGGFVTSIIGTIPPPRTSAQYEQEKARKALNEADKARECEVATEKLLNRLEVSQ